MPVSTASAQVRRQRFRKRFQIGRCSIVPVAEAGSGRNIEGLSARLKRAVKTRAWKASCQGTTVVQIRPFILSSRGGFQADEESALRPFERPVKTRPVTKLSGASLFAVC
jgi:hypothetical protein